MEKLRQKNKLWFVAIQIPGEGDDCEGRSEKEELGLCRGKIIKDSTISPSLSILSLILSFFVHLFIHWILISACYV